MRAWYYARKSPSDTDEQVGVDGQKALCCGEIERRGWDLAGGFEDVAKSAYEAQFRPGYEALLQAIRDGQVDAVVVRHNDRLHRDVEEYKAFTRLARKHKVQVVAVLGGDWTIETAAGRFSGTMLAAVAEYESALKSERVHQALQRRADAGLPANTRFRPYGFEDDGVRHRASEAKALRRAAADLIAGRRSLGEVAREAGKTTTGMRKILTSKRLIGVRVYQGVEYPAAWKPVLDRETFDALGAVLQARATGPGTAHPVRHLLTGLARCGTCGRRLLARQTRGKLVYGCLTAAGNECPRKVQRQADRLDAFVVTSVLASLTEDGRVPVLADNAEALAEVRTLEARLVELEAAMKGASPGAAAALARAYEAVERDLSEAREHVLPTTVLAGSVDAGNGLRRVLVPWEAWWEQASLEDRRALLASTLRQVTVSAAPKGRLPLDTESVDIKWN